MISQGGTLQLDVLCAGLLEQAENLSLKGEAPSAALMLVARKAIMAMVAAKAKEAAPVETATPQEQERHA